MKTTSHVNHNGASALLRNGGRAFALALLVCFSFMTFSAQAMVEKDPTELFWTMLDKAEWGESEAMFAVGMMYLEGTHVEYDDVEAAKWFQKAADEGHSQGMRKLGEMYEKGKGVEQDDEMALYWYKMAAKEGAGEMDDDAYYADMMDMHQTQMAQEHEMEMQTKQQQHEAKMQKEDQRHKESMYRKYYRGSSTRHHN